MSTKTFYDRIRQSIFNGSISAKQFAGIEAILSEYNTLSINDFRKLAYILATAYHETGQTMQPVREIGRGNGYKYGKKFKRSGVLYTSPDHIYYGRGLVQLTWYENYQYMGKLLGLDLLNNPDLLLTMEVSIKVLFEGMLNGKSSFGDFTGKSLENYITKDRTDFYNARRVINGTDAAQKIAGYADLFLKALKIN